MGVAQSRSRRGLKVSGPKINEMFYYGLYSTKPHSKLIKLKHHGQKSIFYDFCLYKDFAKQGVARSCGKATDFRAQIFLGCYWAHESTFKRSLLIIGEKKFFLNHPCVYG